MHSLVEGNLLYLTGLGMLLAICSECIFPSSLRYVYS
jgi:hypothetical protein